MNKGGGGHFKRAGVHRWLVGVGDSRISEEGVCSLGGGFILTEGLIHFIGFNPYAAGG